MRRRSIPGYALLLILTLYGRGVYAQEGAGEYARERREAYTQEGGDVDVEKGGDGYAQNGKLQLSFSTGYQQEGLHWSIAGNSNGQSPNVYSELIWKRTGGPSLYAGLQWRVWKRWTFFAQGRRVFISKGTVSDTDYQGDNRTDATYREQFDSDKGSSADWSAGLGWELLRSRNFRLTPAIGYGISYQSFFLVDHSSGFGALNSSYGTQWRGPFGRIGSELRLAARWTLAAEITYSQVDYSAKADWNLIPTFSHPVSFRHQAEGYGIDMNAALQYHCSPHLLLHLGGGGFTRQTGTGTDRLYLVSGQTDATQLNGVGTDGIRWTGGLKFML